MGNRSDFKSSLNNKLINLTIFVLWFIIICTIVVGFIIWQKTKSISPIIFMPIGILGILFNIYLLSKEKDKIGTK